MFFLWVKSGLIFVYNYNNTWKEEYNIIKHLSLFSGIGAFKRALTNLKIENELVGFSEIDKYPVTAFCAVHNIDESLNYGDIKDINPEDLPDFDLMTWGFPCTDISISGDRKGFDKGSDTKSSLLWEAMRILENKKPKYSIVENVKNLVCKNFKDDFDSWLVQMEELGYKNYWKVLNAKDYGIPQNRERVFIVSIREDVDNDFSFPEPIKLDEEFKKFLESEINKKYLLSVKEVKYMNNKVSDGRDHWDFKFHKDTKDETCTCLLANLYKGVPYNVLIDRRIYTIQNVLQQDAELPILHNIYGGFGEEEPREFREYSPTIRTPKGGGHVPSVCTNNKDKAEKEVADYIIRKLTPLECWRLMGFADKDYWRARTALEKEYYYGRNRSNTRMYKAAGNSIVVPVLEGIFNNLFC